MSPPVSRARSSARALFARIRSCSSRVGVVDVPARVGVPVPVPPASRAFAARATEASTRERVRLTDDDAYNVARGEGDEEGDDDARGGRGAVKPTKRKNHIKHSACEAFTRENMRTHRENERRNAIERREKRIERWRAAGARKRALEAERASTEAADVTHRLLDLASISFVNDERRRVRSETTKCCQRLFAEMVQKTTVLNYVLYLSPRCGSQARNPSHARRHPRPAEFSPCESV